MKYLIESEAKYADRFDSREVVDFMRDDLQMKKFVDEQRKVYKTQTTESQDDDYLTRNQIIKTDEYGQIDIKNSFNII